MTALCGLPYPGLRAFGRNEAHLFFGREDHVDDLIDRLAATRLLAVLGASGSGKSSLVRTGLLSALDLGFFARAGARWTTIELAPGGAPLQQLARALAAVDSSPDGLDEAMVAALLARGPRAIAEWCRGGGLAAGHNLLIVVDQFEELFRFGDYAAREESEAFVGLLLESARTPDVPIHVVLTMRSEYIGSCALIPGLAEAINAGFYLTPRMSREECRAAIEGPAAIAGFTIAPTLVNHILNELAGFAPWEEGNNVGLDQTLSRRADQLPLMQHLLNRLWLRAAARAHGGVVEIGRDDYDAVGGLAGALDAQGAEMLASLEDDHCGVATLFRALVTGPDPARAVRRPCPFGELVDAVGGDRARVGRIVDAFRAPDCNFLRPPVGEALTDATIVDINHESLIRQWRALSEWLRDEARAVANWRRLVAAAELFDAGEGDLLHGTALASLAVWWDAERPTAAWASRHGNRYDEARAFLNRSREVQRLAELHLQARQRRDVRRLWSSIAMLSFLLVLAAGSAFYAFRQSREAAEQAQRATEALRRAEESRGIASSAERQAEDLRRTYALQVRRAAAATVEAQAQVERAATMRREADAQERRAGEAQRRAETAERRAEVANQALTSERGETARNLAPLIQALQNLCRRRGDVEICNLVREAGGQRR